MEKGKRDEKMGWLKRRKEEKKKLLVIYKRSEKDAI